MRARILSAILIPFLAVLLPGVDKKQEERSSADR